MSTFIILSSACCFVKKDLEHGFDDLADIVSLGHRIVMDGGSTMSEEFAALLDGPLDANLIGGIGGLCLTELTDQCLRNVNMERTGQQVNLTLAGDRFQAGNDRDSDACLAQPVDKAEITVVVEEHLGNNIVGTGLYFLLQIQDVGIEIGGLVVFLSIGGHTDTEVGVQTILHRGVEVTTLIEAMDKSHQF